MTTVEIIHKAFDVYCILVYNRTYPYTENNLYQFLKEFYKDYIEGEEEYHPKYNKRLYKIILDMEESQLFINHLKEFIQQHAQVTI